MPEASAYTPTTVSQLAYSALDQDPATTPTPSAAMILLAKTAYRDLWYAHEWAMRYGAVGTKTFEPGEQALEALSAVPDLGDTDKPAWSMKFDPGWVMLTQAYMQRDFRGDARWTATYDRYLEWLKRNRIEDDRQFWTDLLAAAAQDMWTVKGLTYQVCFEVFNARVEADQALLAKRTLLAAVGNIVADGYVTLWEQQPWKFRKIRRTITTVANQPCLALPADFGQLADRAMADDDDAWPFPVTEDNQDFEDARRCNPTGTGPVELGVIESADCGIWVTSTAYQVTDMVFETDTFYSCAVAHTSGTFATDRTAGKWATLSAPVRWRLRFVPIPDDSYAYPIAYLRRRGAPSLTDKPQWPDAFNAGWHAMALLAAQRRYGTRARADEAKAELDEWTALALGELNRQAARPQRIETDAYGDFGVSERRQRYSTSALQTPWFP